MILPLLYDILDPSFRKGLDKKNPVLHSCFFPYFLEHPVEERPDKVSFAKLQHAIAHFPPPSGKSAVTVSLRP